MNRFIAIGAKTMIDLVNQMQAISPLAHLRYLGPNGGDYSNHLEREKLEDAHFIAVFDLLPLSIALVNTYTQLNDDSKITLSA